MKTHWRETLLVTFAYAIMAAVMTYPLLLQLSVGVASHSQDVWILLWDNWWVQHALATGQNIFFTTLMFYPNGVSLAAHSFSFTHTAISLLFQVFTDPIAAYNLGIFLIFPVSGLGMYWLAREVTRSRWAAWIAGLIYAFAPYHMTQALGHPHLSYVQFIPFAVLFVLKAIATPRVKYLVAAIVGFTLTAYAGPHLLVLAFTWLALFLPFAFLAERRRVDRGAIVSVSAIVMGTLLLSLPLILPAALDVLSGQSMEELQTGDFDNTQTDALAYFVPTRYQPVFGAALTDTYRNLGKNNQWMPYLGYAALLLAVAGVATQRRRALGWLIAGLTCIVLALGAQLRVNGVTYTDIPLPFTVLQNVFPFSFLRSPDRFNVVVSLSLAVLAAFGFAALERRWPGSRRGLAVIASGLIVFEYLSVPYPMMSPPVSSPFFEQLALDADTQGIVDLPMGRNLSKVYLYWQTIHHQPLVEGHVSRTPAHAYDFIDGNALLSRWRAEQPLESDPFLQALRQGNHVDPALVDVSHQLRQLADAGVRYIVLHKKFARPDQLAAWRDWLTFSPVYEDDELVVYRTDPQWGRDFTPAYSLNDAIGLIRATLLEPDQNGLIRVDARWASRSSPGRDYDVCLHFVNAANQVAQSQCGPLASDWPTANWGASEVVRGGYDLHVDALRPSGRYTLTVALADGPADRAVGPAAAIGLVNVDPAQRVTVESLPTHNLKAVWGDVIRLNGYGLGVASDSLELTVYWQALRSMQTSYKVFVHVVDPVTGAIVAQDDSVPRHWTHPTNTWQPGEVVEDTLAVPLSGVAPGEYQLFIGLYDAVTGERLAAFSTDGQRQPDDAVLITAFRH
jgi:hypothetical protein